MPRNRTRRRADSTALNGSSIPPRSKAGCWTCRIRRKRCDEQQDESGACQACVRLDIECLGWGTRRPDWCRDKDALNQYKLNLKRKLCSRAGTRPSASKSAAHAQSDSSPTANANVNNHEYHDVTRAPSGESPRVSSSSVAGLDDDELETDDYSTIFSPHSPWNTLSSSSSLSPPVMAPLQLPSQQLLHYKPTVSPLSILGPNLSNLLGVSRLPAEYATLTSQLIDLYLYKSRAFNGTKSSAGAAEQELAHRAQVLEAELNRLSNRASFDNLFSSALGFDFDPSFLSASTVSSGHGMEMNQYNSSPMAMWSPDLMSDAMSNFSGSSAPTSPAAPLIAMASNSYSFNEFLGYDNGAHVPQPLFDMQTFSSPVLQQQQQPMMTTGMNTGMGALGLSSEYMFNEMPTYNNSNSTPSISLLPPTRAGTMEMDLMSAKTVPSPSTPFQDTDPFQIHQETCLLLLQAILSNDSSPSLSFDSSSPFSLESNSPVEDCLQRLTSKFLPLKRQVQQGIPTEYLFSATLAGALSSSQGRRAFFRDIVNAVEARLGTMVGMTLLNEVWNQ